jgi:hypothetical protein
MFQVALVQDEVEPLDLNRNLYQWLIECYNSNVHSKDSGVAY